MIVKNQYPICEFDTSKNPIIHPANFLSKSLPEKCVIIYVKLNVIERLLRRLFHA